MQKKAVILFSGGLDSTTCLAIATSQGFESYALSFAYGQKHNYELQAAAKIAKTAGVYHRIIQIDIGQFGGSALTDQNLSVPDYQASSAIPSTYVPARNTIFLAIALGFAETIGAYDIFIGANQVDYSNYPDCRPEFIHAFEQLANCATKAGSEGNRTTVHAPLLNLSKAEIIQAGHKLGINYGETVSCYRLDDIGRACGTCDSCMLRAKGFIAAGVADPTKYTSSA